MWKRDTECFNVKFSYLKIVCKINLLKINLVVKSYLT